VNKSRNTHAPYTTLTALNQWTILLLDITDWLANSTRELCTTASADGSDRSVIIEEENEKKLFAKKAGSQKGLQHINAGYRKHKHYVLKQLNQCQVSKH